MADVKKESKKVAEKETTKPAVNKEATKVASKSVAKAPATKPVVTKETIKTASKPVAKEVAKPVATKEVAKPAVKKEAAKPAVKKEENKEVSKPVTKKPVEEKVEKVVDKPKTVEPKSAVKPKTIKSANKTVQYIATGRRKQSVARVRLIPNGKGIITINDKDIEEYFQLGTLKQIARQAFELTETSQKFDTFITVHGGGLTGQAGAIRHGISRALVKSDEQLKAEIKKAGFLTRDARVKERKKYGLKKARKAPQFRKR